MNIEPIKRTNLHDIVAEKIEEYIKQNEIKSGIKLPSERDLCEMFSISRSSLREGIRRLEMVNLVEVINGKGIFVKNPTATVKGINLQVQIQKEQLMQTLQIRRVLEEYALELAVENITNEDIQEIELILLKMEDKSISDQKLCEVEDEFHGKLYNLSGNEFLVNLLDNIRDVSREIWSESNEHLYRLLRESIPHHRQLFEAIKSKDKEKLISVFEEMIEVDIKLIK